MENSTSNKKPVDINQINDKLYLGDYWSAFEKDHLKKLDIKQILVCGDDLKFFHPNDFTYKKINIRDKPDQNISKYFKECIEFIEQDNTLVHCQFGISRSASIVICYIMFKNKMTLVQALSFVTEKRNKVKPNSGFIEQLENFELKLISNNWEL